MRHRHLPPVSKALAALAVALSTSGCLGAASSEPVAIASAAPPQGTTLAAAETVPPKAPQSDGDPALLDRVPTAAQIFDFHPKGSPKSAWREPFLISPDDGPLKIHKFSAADLGETAAPAAPPPAAPRPRKLGEVAAAVRQVHLKPAPYPPPLLGTAPPPYPTDR